MFTNDGGWRGTAGRDSLFGPSFRDTFWPSCGETNGLYKIKRGVTVTQREEPASDRKMPRQQRVCLFRERCGSRLLLRKNRLRLTSATSPLESSPLASQSESPLLRLLENEKRSVVNWTKYNFVCFIRPCVLSQSPLARREGWCIALRTVIYIVSRNDACDDKYRNVIKSGEESTKFHLPTIREQ